MAFVTEKHPSLSAASMKAASEDSRSLRQLEEISILENKRKERLSKAFKPLFDCFSWSGFFSLCVTFLCIFLPIHLVLEGLNDHNIQLHEQSMERMRNWLNESIIDGEVRWSQPALQAWFIFTSLTWVVVQEHVHRMVTLGLETRFGLRNAFL